MSGQPENLPDGTWKDLLAKALQAVDEIRVHGGVADPFYTFGGGTVLHLRYGHRFSKDIDFFVPDGQSLGYVNPRLSDVAADLCDSQYIEAPGFIKLQLDAGEIDFVIGSNLLPAEHAYETWELLGQKIRVETPAEIVAKKMYFRGDRGTARDLFDLSLVVEREPDAMRIAAPFFLRHLDSFLEHLDAPTENFRRQFGDIQTINYTPTFEHATKVVGDYLGGLKLGVAESLTNATAFAQQQGVTPETADHQRGRYIGAVAYEGEHHLVQSVGRGQLVIHDKHRLPMKFDRQDAVDFSYSDGQARAMPRRPGQQLGR